MSYYDAPDNYYVEDWVTEEIGYILSLNFFRKDGKEMTMEEDYNAIKAEMARNGYGAEGYDFEDVTTLPCSPDEECNHSHIATSYESWDKFEYDRNKWDYEGDEYKNVVKYNWKRVKFSPEFSEVYDYTFTVVEADI